MIYKDFIIQKLFRTVVRLRGNDDNLHVFLFRFRLCQGFQATLLLVTMRTGLLAVHSIRQPETYRARTALAGADALSGCAVACFRLAARSAFFLAAAACILVCCSSLGRLKYTPAITTAIAVL